jgi:peptide deformylase
MGIREIITIPDPRLRLKSAPVETVDDDVRALVDDMFKTMYDAPGIGLAAIQVAVPKQVITMDLSGDEDPAEPRVFINPEIVWAADELSTHQEGCLSIPEYFEDVDRPNAIRIRYLDRDGGKCELEADGLLATCLQHEVDHLNGILFIDYLSRLKRDRVIKKFTKQARQTLKKSSDRGAA